jgi:hypothetical protein
MATAKAATSQPNNYGVGGTPGSGAVDNVRSQTGNSNSSQSGGQQTAQSGTSTTANNATTTTQNMTPEQIAQLNGFISMLMGGGTPDMRAATAARTQERGTVINLRNNFSKDQAFIDAAGLINQQTRRTMEKLLPTISRAAEDAGSSGGALRALLMQDAANKASESGAALGAQQAAQYGQLQVGFSQIMENLTRADPALAQTIVGALNVAKGSTTTSTTNGTQTTTNSGNTNQTSQQTGQTNTNQTRFTDYAPLVSTAPTFYGNTDPINGVDPSKYVGSTLDTLSQLNNQNPWVNRVTF